jgi:hypothetical protein
MKTRELLYFKKRPMFDSEPAGRIPIQEQTHIELMGAHQDRDDSDNDEHAVTPSKSDRSLRFAIHTQNNSYWLNCLEAKSYEQWLSALMPLCAVRFDQMTLTERAMTILLHEVIDHRNDFNLETSMTAGFVSNMFRRCPVLTCRNSDCELPLTTLSSRRLREKATDVSDCTFHQSRITDGQ